MRPSILGRRRFLRTPLGADECSERLRASKVSWWEYLNVRVNHEKPVWGRVGESGFCLLWCIPYGNPLQTQVVGRYQSDGGGTQIDCRLGVPLWAFSFYFVWLALVAVASLSFLMAYGLGWGLMSFAVLVLGLAMVALCLWLARDEERLLTEFLVRQLDARVES